MKREASDRIRAEMMQTYDSVAAEFSNSRARFWDELAYLSEHATSGARVLDIGCGNGRFFPLIEKQGARYTGVDFSLGLLSEARKRHPKITLVHADATALPFPDRSFDVAFAFATIHHIPGDDMREQFVREAGRVLNHGSTFILTAWDLWQQTHALRIARSYISALNPFSPLEARDIMLPLGKQARARYLHAFTLRELVRTVERGGFTVVGTDIVSRESGSGNKNILVVAKKN